MDIYALPARSMVRLETHDAKVALPFLPDMKTAPIPGTNDYIYSFSVYYTNTTLEQTGYSITPSACVEAIRVNHIAVPFNKRKSCDPRAGVYWLDHEAPLYLSLTHYLQNGRNTIEVQTRRAEFDMGPLILCGSRHLSTWLGLAMILVACIMLVVVVKRQTGEYYSGYILTCGFLVYMNRLSHMGVSQYHMDLPGHLDYITYIASHWRLPEPFSGWSYFHAPLYYIIGAIIVTCADMCRSFDVFTCLQLFSLGCFMAFILFSTLTLRRVIATPIAYYTAITLLVFFPCGILFSSRVDSNLLFYAWYSACIYFTLRWLQSTTTIDFIRNFGIAIIMLGLAMATRTNALILFPILFLAILFRRIKWGWPAGFMQNRLVRIGLVVFCLGITASVARTEFYRLLERHHGGFLVGNTTMLSHHLVIHQASFSTLFIPNISLYLQHPYLDTALNQTGRQYFWDAMLKTSLFGEFSWKENWLAFTLIYVILGLVIYIIDGYIVHRRFLRSCPEWWLCLLSLAIPIAALMGNRVINPFACSQDFRYIYPSVASFCGLFGLVLERHIIEWRPFRKTLGMILGLGFAFCSVKFYLV